MYDVNSHSLLLAIAGAQIVRAAVWVGLVLLTGALVVLARTNWGQSKPLRKCIVLSLIAHLLLAIYTTTVTIVSASMGNGRDGTVFNVELFDGPADVATGTGEQASPGAWETYSTTESTPPLAAIEARPAPPPTELPPTNRRPVARPPELPKESVATKLVSTPEWITTAASTPHPSSTTTIRPAAPIETPAPVNVRTPGEPGQATLAPSPDNRSSSDVAAARGAPVTIPERLAGSPNALEPPSEPGVRPDASSAPPLRPIQPDALGVPSAIGASTGTGTVSAGPVVGPGVPELYSNRIGENHDGVAARHGGSRETEAAVASALKWLAAHQSQDGRWDPRALGGGREVMVDGQDRGGAGSQADTGITGIVLLPFLGAGHTHLQGPYQDTVRRGLQFLLDIQGPDGNLMGNAATYEKMYCHAMATLALSEAYALSRDKRLEPAVRRAVVYCLSAQDPKSGGWRYQPRDPGDTSQLGWQVMALKSAELAGIAMPEDCRQGIMRYLASVSSGTRGGLASYRPGHRASRPMTAEALVCRQFMGMRRDDPSADEAGNFLLEEVPGVGQANVYYWYYATLAMYQLQGEHWRRWNQAITTTLLHGQRLDGDLAGSWDPDAVWGAYGGRAYSTALSALCLEVYYRYLPLYVEAASRQGATTK